MLPMLNIKNINIKEQKAGLVPCPSRCLAGCQLMKLTWARVLSQIFKPITTDDVW